jgi:hypothetical protein
VQLVEAACALVSLEDPQLEPGRQDPLRVVEQSGAHAAVLSGGRNVEVADEALVESQEADDPCALLCNPHLVPLDDCVPEFGPVLVRNRRQVGHQVAGAEEDAADGMGVLCDRASDHALIFGHAAQA